MALRDALTDVRGLRVGHWTSRRSATGCTVILCPPSTVGGVDVRGAAPGTREIDLLRPGNHIEEVHAIVLSGGSAYGLDAATGVMRYLEEKGGIQEDLPLTTAVAPGTSRGATQAQSSSYTSGDQAFDMGTCPDCGTGHLAFEEGCKKCHICGYSECG